MYCTQCGHEYADGGRFCGQCGVQIEGAVAPSMPGMDGLELQLAATSRPLGVVLVTVYTAIAGIFCIVLALPMMGGGVVSQWFPLLGVLLLVIGVLDIAAGYGLWALLPWGHALATVLYAISIPLSLLLLIAESSGAGDVISQLVSIGIDIGVLIWLNNPTTKRLYRKP